MIRSLRRKFIAVTMTIVTVFLFVMLAFVIRTTADRLETECVTALKQAAEDPIPQIGPGQRKLPCFVIHVTPWGYGVQSAGGFDLSDEEALVEIITLAGSAKEELGELEGYSLRYYRRQKPTGLTLAFADISGEEAALRHLSLSCLGIGAAAIAAFWILCILLARWAVRPVETAWEEQRRFVADASHELKTPLTVIMTNAELLQSDSVGEEQRSRCAQSILTMSRQMRALVESLLELARVDHGAVRTAFEDTDLSALISEELLVFEPLCFEQGLRLEEAVEPQFHVSGSPRHLRQVVGILLDNARKYSTPEGPIRVRLTRQGPNALLTVENPGPPMSREECQKIFQRFYRLDKSRSGGGYGLGLSIAQSITAEHGGKIWAESQSGWIALRLTLPLTRPEEP